MSTARPLVTLMWRKSDTNVASPAEGNREHDIVFTTQELVEFATSVWEIQFDDEQE